MKSLVIDLQKECIDSSIPVNQVLRKALIISQKISDEDFKIWLELELNGYKKVEDLPDYRKVSGSFKEWNPFHGLVPIDFKSVQDAEKFSRKNMFQPVGELEGLFRNPDKDGMIESPIPPRMKNSLLKITGGMEPVYILNLTELLGIIENVKNIILQWALNLEEEGILGEELDFTQEEKENAKNITFNINQMVNSQIQSDTNDSLQVLVNQDYNFVKLEEFIKELKLSLDRLEISEDKRNELKSDVNSIESQINSPKPKSPIIREGLKSVRNILEGAAGSILAAELLKMLLKSVT